MKRIRIIFLFVLVSSFPMNAQSVSSDNIRTEIIKFCSRVSSIDCDFVQTNVSTLLTDALVSTGHMTYRKPGYLEWSYMEPDHVTIIADGDSVAIAKGNVIEALNGNQSRMVRELTRMIISNLEGSFLTNDKMFKAEFALTDGFIIATLFPQKRDYKKMWSRLVLYYDQISKNATRFEMFEASGDMTYITFSNIKNGFSE